MVSFRKSKKLGPIRLTASKRGLSLSGGVPGARVSANTKGEVRRTLSAPGTGLYDTKKIGGSKRATKVQGTQAMPDQEVSVQAIDATGGSRALLSGQADIAYLQVVEVGDAYGAAAFAGIGPNPQGWVRGIRDAVLIPQGDQYRVTLLVQPADNPGIFTKKDQTTKGKDIGRIGKRDLDKWRTLLVGRIVHAVAYIDVTPGLDPTVEVRFRPELLEQSPEEGAATPPEPGWLADPEGEAAYRYWDGAAWTEHVSNGV